MRRIHWPIVFVCVLALPAAARAQQSAARPDKTRLRVERVFPAATIGAGVGLLAGAHFGSQLGWGGGDDPGLISAFLFAGIGSALGSGLGARIVEPRLPTGRALASGVLGLAGGVLGIVALGEIFEGDGDLAIIAFSVLSGGVTTLAASATRR
jgi:hypothetical protein